LFSFANAFNGRPVSTRDGSRVWREGGLANENGGRRKERSRADFTFGWTGSIQINATTKLTKIDDRMIRTILQSYKSECSSSRFDSLSRFARSSKLILFRFSPVHNCDVMVREDIDTDEFIDVLLGNRKYLQCLYVRPFLFTFPLLLFSALLPRTR